MTGTNEVIAPTPVTVKAGDRVKTDRRHALKLARSYRSSDLTPVRVPDAGSEALRDLVRAREAANPRSNLPRLLLVLCSTDDKSNDKAKTTAKTSPQVCRC